MIKNIEKRYTESANPWRGFHDFEQIVTFNDSSYDEQLAEMKRMRQDLRIKNMWVYDPVQLRENVWLINFGYDSGD